MRLACALLISLLALAACQDGGLVGTGSGPSSSETLMVRTLPSDLSPNIPRSALLQEGQTKATHVHIPEEPAAGRSLSGQSSDLFNAIYNSEKQLLELFALFNTTLDSVETACSGVALGAECHIPPGYLRATYTRGLVDGLIADRLASTTVAQLTPRELSQLIENLTTYYDAKLGSSVTFGETTVTRLASGSDVLRVKTSLIEMFAGEPIKVTWSELEDWVEVKHMMYTKNETSSVYFRYEQHPTHTKLTRSQVSSDPNEDTESSITIIGRYDETLSLLWSGHSLGIGNDYGVTSLSLKGRADFLGAYTRSRLHSPHGTDATRLLDREESRDPAGSLLAKRYCSGSLNNPLCININVDGQGLRVYDSPNYVDFDDDATDFLPDLHITKWQVDGLPRSVWRFAVYSADTTDPNDVVPLCRGYRIGNTRAYLHCTAGDEHIDPDNTILYEIVVNGAGQQFVYIPDARLVR
ncbi:MAG: hypothetical protein AAF499_09495 [Pseudomonadota bacterium]